MNHTPSYSRVGLALRWILVGALSAVPASAQNPLPGIDAAAGGSASLEELVPDAVPTSLAVNEPEIATSAALTDGELGEQEECCDLQLLADLHGGQAPEDGPDGAGPSGDESEEPALASIPASVIDVTAITGQRVVGPVTSWQTRDGPYNVEHLAGRSPTGDVLTFYRSTRNWTWRYVNVSQETGGVRVTGNLTSWVMTEGTFTVEHLAGRNATGELVDLFWSPQNGRWRYRNLTRITGQHIADSVVSWKTTGTNGVVFQHLAGRSPTGDLLTFWATSANNWLSLNVSQITGGRRLVGAVTSWQKVVNGLLNENLAGVGTDGALLVFSWVPGRGWAVQSVTAVTGRTIVGAACAWQTGDVEHLGGAAADGSLLVFWRSSGRNWQVANVSQITDERVQGRPTPYQLPDSSENVELLSSRNASGQLIVHWWKPSRDWQAINLSEITGKTISAAPEGWLTYFDDRIDEHLAAAGADQHLLVFEGFSRARQLTDALSRPFYSLHRMRNIRRNVLVICWDPHYPELGGVRPSASQMQSIVFGATNSVRSYFLENSGGYFTIENAGVVGWLEACCDLGYYDRNEPCRRPDGACDPGEPRHKAVAAITAASRSGFNFSTYDTNHDHVLTPDELAIVFVHPGGPDGTTRPIPSVTVNGVRIDIAVDMGIGNPPSLGTVAHELSHLLLGHGDMYFNGVPSPMPSAAGDYSLMDHSSKEVHLDPFAKLKFGWARPKIIFRSGSYSLPNVETSRRLWVLMDPARGPNEYFLVENRWRGTSYDAGRARGGISDQGLAVWHIVEPQAGFNQPPWYVPAPIWALLGAGDWPHKAIRMVRPVLFNTQGGLTFDDGRALWDGSDPQTGYDLLSADTNARHNKLRWSDGTPSGFAIRSISAAGPTMSATIQAP